MKKLKIISLAILAFSLHSCRKDYMYIAPAAPPAPPVTTTVLLSTDVYPLLITPTANCNSGCHGALDFSSASLTRSTLLSTSNVIPGDANGSMLITSITTGGPAGLMPEGATVPAFTNSELEIIKAWINQGALDN